MQTCVVMRLSEWSETDRQFEKSLVSLLRLQVTLTFKRSNLTNQLNQSFNQANQFTDSTTSPSVVSRLRPRQADASCETGSANDPSLSGMWFAGIGAFKTMLWKTAANQITDQKKDKDFVLITFLENYYFLNVCVVAFNFFFSFLLCILTAVSVFF